MKKLILGILSLSLMFTLAAAPGSADDPLVTKSWVDSYISKSTKNIETELAGLSAKLTGSSSKNIDLWIGKKYASVGGAKKTLEAAPVLKGGYTMVPLRFIGECLGANFEWDNTKKQVTYLKTKTKIVLQINKKEISINNVTKPIDTAVILVNNRTMAPLRVISENLGAQVNWINNEKRVNIILNN